MHTMKLIAGAMVVSGSLCVSSAWSAPIVFSGSGAAATTALDAFRTAIGGVKNTAAPQATGRREISWDGVKLDGTDANPNTQVVDANKTVIIPTNRFQNQGTLFADPYAVSGDGFGSVNGASAGQFSAFSPKNTFVMQDATAGQFDDRFIGESFTIPGTTTGAGTRGFGAIFLEGAGSSIEYFGRKGNGDEVSLGTFAVPIGANGETQFLAVLFDDAVVTDVNLTVGTNALFSFDGNGFQSFGSENLARGVDFAVTDDFIFAEPTTAVAVAVPEPASIALMLAGLAIFGRSRARGRINEQPA
ncbi:MAG: PEP-CTERM sorting domain-containing protein [Burkholderiales bacterium]